MALGWNGKKVGRGVQEAGTFLQVARGNTPPTWSQLIGRPFAPDPSPVDVRPALERMEYVPPSTDVDISMIVSQLTLKQRIELLRYVRQQNP